MGDPELDLLLRVPGELPLPEVGPRVVAALRRLRGADRRETARLEGWCELLARRLRGEPTPLPADPLQRPTILYLDGFEDRAWHDARRYPVTGVLEQAFTAVRAEFFERTRSPERWAEYREGVAADRKWRAVWFYRYGRRQAETAALYPRTSALIDELSGPDGPLSSKLGDAFLSRLEAFGRIPPHNGLCNISLVCHLALAIPERCGIRVGAESREWEEGKCLVFDDTFEHETWNESASDRYVLVLPLWQGGVSPVEREFMTLITAWLNRLAATQEAG
ncbi:MAG TPA: aspartyl/asparaginyl beta-hydroxylase domain-containing protein [Vicinamibacteria bacterium]|nr:aspartyl/asparaginyl beta-hydroxylase domain-containing protein [Vicinamibacteria bacterium]